MRGFAKFFREDLFRTISNTACYITDGQQIESIRPSNYHRTQATLARNIRRPWSASSVLYANSSKKYLRTGPERCYRTKAFSHARNLKRKPLVKASFLVADTKHKESGTTAVSSRVPLRKGLFAQDGECQKVEQAPSEKFRKREGWQLQKEALKEKFRHNGWLPRKRLSPDALEGIRAIHAQYPDKYTTPVLAEKFKVSPEAIRRILKSKWRPDDEEEKQRQGRWNSRGERIWNQMADIGLHPPKKWREMGIQSSKGQGKQTHC